MRVLIDANIPLNVWLSDRPYAAERRTIMEAAGNDVIQAYMTPSLIVFALAVCAKAYNGARYRDRANGLLNIVNIIDQPKPVFQAAVQAEQWKDMEDSFQYHTALRHHQRIQAIITSNGKDYGNSTIAIYQPDEFVRRHLSGRKR